MRKPYKPKLELLIYASKLTRNGKIGKEISLFESVFITDVLYIVYDIVNILKLQRLYDVTIH